MNGASIGELIIDELADTSGNEDGVDHVVCCEDENLAMCGKDVTGIEWATRDNGNQACVICAIMDDVIYRRLCRGEGCGTACPKKMRRE